MTDSDISSLKASFAGELLRSADDGYEAARQIWNAGIDKHPALIARCSSESDVIAAVHFARDRDLVTAIRGGGHNVGGRALCDGGMVIDLSRMRRVEVDPATRMVRVEGGATLEDLDRETHAFGWAVPSGTHPKTGVAGLALGGGVGWLVRKFGMTIDSMLSCEVVTAKGERLVTNLSEREDLFWALRGGGGNFGVVTSFEFQAHPVHTVTGGFLIYPRDAAFDVLRNFRDFVADAPDEVTAYAALLMAPDGTAIVGIVPCYCGEASKAARILAPLSSFGSPLANTIQAIPYPQMQRIFSPFFPDGNHHYWKSTLHEDLPDEAIAIVVEQANRMSSPLSAVAIEHYGGAAGRISPDATAFPHRDLHWCVLLLAQWKDASEMGRHRDWAYAGEKELRRFAADAHLLAALDVEAPDVIRSAFGVNLPRLKKIKEKYDSENFFRVNQNIVPDRPVTAAVAG